MVAVHHEKRASSWRFVALAVFAMLCAAVAVAPANRAVAEDLQEQIPLEEAAAPDADEMGEEVEVAAAPEALAASEGTPDASDDLNLAAQDGYEGGTIPILRFTFRDDIDPETGEVVLSGDEKIALMQESANHEYRATGVSLDVEVPATYDNPEEDLWDGASGYTGETALELEFIRGRGNSTWRTPKKPYKFKLDKSADLFGMGKNKHWVLIANFYDTSLTVDRLVGWIGEQMGMAFTPRAVPVDLYLNDEYCGNYLLMEEVRVDDNRVALDIVGEDVSDPDSLDITGDYLLGVNRKPTALNYEWFSTSRGNSFTWDTPEYGPEPTETEQAQQAYVKSHMERVEDAVYAKDLTNSRGEGVWDLIDEDSLADYWWVQEYTTNRDGFATPSTYVYKVRDTMADDGTVTVGKLYWGPLWDFDFVWGGFPAEGFDNTEARWVERLRQDPEFVELLKERWRVLDAVLEEATREGGLLDQYVDEMATSWEANQERWPKEDQYGWPDGSYAEAIEELREHMEARRAWINGHLDELLVQFYSVTFVDGDEPVLELSLRYGTPPWEDAPEASEPEGMIFEGWYADDGRAYDSNEVYDEDIVFRARYADASTVSAAEDIFFSTPELWTCYPARNRYELMPNDAVDQRIEWSSSDEGVVTVDQDGTVYPVDGCLDGVETARATVTARLVGSGKTASFDVVVYQRGGVILPEPETITVEPEMALEVGEYQQVSYSAEPSPNQLNVYNDLEYQVEDESVAEVSDLGIVVGKNPGVTTVSVVRRNPDTYVLETVGVVTVTVTERAPEPTPEPTPTPEPEPTPKPSPAPAPHPVEPTNRTNTLPKTGDEAAELALAVTTLAAAGSFLLAVGFRLRMRNQ